MLEPLLQLLLFILPAYMANSTPVIFGGGTPMDFGGKAWDGKRCLGDGKTWRGFAAGMAFGTLTGICESSLFGNPSYTYLGFLLAFGALTGDTFGSFFKRRLGMDRGHPTFLVDQLPFFAVALAIASPIYLPSWEGIMVLAVATYFLHAGTNLAANRLGLKKVPW